MNSPSHPIKNKIKQSETKQKKKERKKEKDICEFEVAGQLGQTDLNSECRLRASVSISTALSDLLLA